MTIKGLENAARAMTRKTGVTYQVRAISGFYHIQHVTSQGSVCSVLCARSKKDLFNAVCTYLLGYQHGRNAYD
jgi:hypothetical protein